MCIFWLCVFFNSDVFFFWVYLFFNIDVCFLSVRDCFVRERVFCCCFFNHWSAFCLSTFSSKMLVGVRVCFCFCFLRLMYFLGVRVFQDCHRTPEDIKTQERTSRLIYTL